MIVPLEHVGRAGTALVGGKARGFAVLAAAGLKVPTGFVVTTEAFHGLGGSPNGLRDAVAEHVALLGDGPLAVRSSATDEDGAERSHAGQYLTRLGVRGVDGVVKAVAECWASAGDERALAYRRDRGADDQRVAMAVLVQRLVAPDASGVCTSVDPLTGDPVTVVNAAWGLGEAVVSGLVTPDDYRLARHDGRLLRFEPGWKDVMIVPGPEGVQEAEVAFERREARVLDDRVLAALHDGVLLCEAVLGMAVDCEFCVTGDELTWLQCRPLTALSLSRSASAPPTNPRQAVDHEGDLP
jgi:pyruvate,water dikinase